MEKEKLLKKICKKELMAAWEWGHNEAVIEMKGYDPGHHRRFKRNFPRDLTMALKKAGVLPL